LATQNANAAGFFVDRHAAAETAEKAAFIEGIEGGRSLSYRALAEASARMADLYERHGINREDRAALIVLDRIEFPIIFWGSLKAGVVPVPLNTLLPPELYALILRDSRARALFVSSELLGVVRPILADLPFLKVVFVIGDGDDADVGLSFREELKSGVARPAIETSADECAFWLYSSGSTGEPKGVRHVHSSLRATYDTYGRQVLGIDSGDTVFSAAKLFFAYGLGNGMTFPMAVGATTVLFPGRPVPADLFEVARRTKPTIFYAVPTLYAALLQAMDDTKLEGFERLRLCVSAGEALPEGIGRRWRAATGVDILDGGC
jgi:4-hydroxybenzoate-CoA ligase